MLDTAPERRHYVAGQVLADLGRSLGPAARIQDPYPWMPAELARLTADTPVRHAP